MGYGIRDGDIIATENKKVGALTLSQPLYDFRAAGTLDPYDLWATQPAVRTVIGFISRTVASVPFNVYQTDGDGGRVVEPTHPLHRALHSPWPKQGQGRFIESLINDLYIFGRWCFVALPTKDGGYEFPRIKANQFSIEVDGFGRPTGIKIYDSKQSHGETFPIKDFVFDLGPEPIHGDNRIGSTSVSTLEDLAKELVALGEYREDLFKNSARVPAVIERPTDAAKWSDASWERFKTEFATYKPGGGNAGGTPILEDGMTYKPIDTVSPKDAQYIDVRKLALEEAAEALHVPPELVGAREGTYSNIVALREQLYLDVLGPLIRWITEAMNAGLSHLLAPGEEIRADVDSKVRTDWATRSKIYQTSVGAPIMTVNEARNNEGLPSLPGGDELITPLNVVKGGLASPTDTGQTNENDPADPLPDISLGKARPQVPGANKAAENTPEILEEGDETDGQIFSEFDYPELVRRIEDFSADIYKAMDKIVTRLRDRLGVEEEKARGVKASAANVQDALSAAFRAQDQKTIIKILENHLGLISAESSFQQFAQLGAEVGAWAPGNQHNWLSKAGESYAQLLIDDRLYSKLGEAIFDSDSDNKIRAILNKANLTAQKWLTQTVTEVVSFGAKDAAEAAEATHKTWVTTSKNPRKSHQQQNGVTVDIRDEFPNGLRWPGDWTGSGPETANCKCRIVYEYLF